MNTVLVFLAVSAVIIPHCLSLQCYTCQGQDPCTEAQAHKTTKCGENIGSRKQAFCTKAVKNSETNQKLALRRCQITDQGKEPECAKDYKCDKCQSDFCNSGNNIHIGNVAMRLFGAVAMTILLAYSI